MPARPFGVTLMFAVVLTACTACLPFGLSTTESPDTQALVQQSVEEALPDATAVIAQSSTSGLSYGWNLEIDYPADMPLTAEVLSDTLHAVVDVDPDGDDVTLYFFEAGTDTPLPIREAADELGLPWTPVGSGASWLAGQLD